MLNRRESLVKYLSLNKRTTAQVSLKSTSHKFKYYFEIKDGLYLNNFCIFDLRNSN